MCRSLPPVCCCSYSSVSPRKQPCWSQTIAVAGALTPAVLEPTAPLAKPGHRRWLQLIWKDVVGGLAWIIARKMNLLCRKIDRFKRFSCLRRRQTFLAAHDRALQCTFEGAVDPDANIEVLSIGCLKKKDSLEQYDVDLAERVAMFAEIRRSFSGEIRFHIDATCLSQR